MDRHEARLDAEDRQQAFTRWVIWTRCGFGKSRRMTVKDFLSRRRRVSSKRESLVASLDRMSAANGLNNEAEEQIQKRQLQAPEVKGLLN